MQDSFDLEDISKSLAEEQDTRQQRQSFASEQKKTIGKFAKIDYKSFSMAFFAMEEESKQNKDTMNCQQKIAELIGMVWDEFFSCNPPSQNSTENRSDIQCVCGLCEEDSSNSSRINARAKCNMIPKQLKFFCQELYRELHSKFPMHSGSLIAEFLFDRWILKALCTDANKNGLITNAFIKNSKNFLADNL